MRTAVKRIALLTILFVPPVSSGRCLAESPTPAATLERVDELIEQLDSSNRSIRTAAERRLKELGPSVLPHLPPPDRLSSAAVRDAVLRVRELLEREKATQSVRPSRVTLDGTHSLADVLKQLTARTGNEIRTSDLSQEVLGHTLELNLDDATFWDSHDAIAAQTDVVTRFNSDDGMLEVVPSKEVDSRSVATTNVGAFRIDVQDVSLRPDFTDPKRKIVRVRYTVAVEPRLRPLFVRVNHTDFQLSAGENMYRPLDEDAQRERPADRPGPISLIADFVVPADSTFDEISLNGRVTMELAAGQEPFVFRNLETAEYVVRRSAGVTVTLERAVFGNGGEIDPIRIDLSVAYDQGGPAFESHRTWVYHNDAALQTDNGSKRWTPDRFDTPATAETAVRLSYHFDPTDAAPSQLEFTYTAPTLLLSVPVSFEVTNLAIDDSRTAED